MSSEHHSLIGSNMFKEKFKYFRRKKPKPDFKSVISLQNIDTRFFISSPLLGADGIDRSETSRLGLKNLTDWHVYEFRKYPGLIFIANPFTGNGQRYWIARSLADYSKKPSVTNLDSQSDVQKIIAHTTWWDAVMNRRKEESCGKPIAKKLRWATLGYHHDWDTKVYSEDAKSSFPNDLSALSQLIIRATLNISFNAEAAIVNYYFMDSFLNGHADYSEPNLAAPLVSFSFGQTALFLIGGVTPDEVPEAVFLESGDIVLMAGSSRLRYHGVPKIMVARSQPWNTDIRTLAVQDSKNGPTNAKVEDNDTHYEDQNRVTMNLVQEPEYWRPFNEFINEARINLNVRQVM